MAYIDVCNVYKDFKIAKSVPGVLGSLKSLFHREYIIKHAVSDISFQITPGEMVGYVGPNGAGKSTTIKMLSGVLTPSAGKITVDGIVPYEQRKKNAYHIGVVFGQKSQLYWDLPIEDTFEVYKKMYNVEDHIYRENKEYFIEALDMREFMDQPVRQLSLGQKMKANIALSMLHNPPVLYLDEPTIGLDVVSKTALRSCIQRLNREKNTTILLTTHDMDDIEAICSRIILIDHGKKLYDGTIEQFKHQYDNGYIVTLYFTHLPKWKASEQGRYTLLSQTESSWDIRVGKDILTKDALTELITLYEPVNVSLDEPNVEDIIRTVFSKERKD